MIRRPPRSTRTDQLFPYPTLFRSVREVAVTGVDDALLGQVVAAFLVRDGDVPSEMAVKAHCRQRLAGYKIPKQVAFVAELPRTASGKIRRAALTQET